MCLDQKVGFLEPPGGLEAKQLLILLILLILHTEINEGF